MFTACVDGFIYIESVDASGAAGDHSAAAALGEDDGGPIVAFDQPGGDDAYDALMPVGLVKNGGPAFGVVGVFLEDGQGPPLPSCCCRLLCGLLLSAWSWPA